MLNRAFCGALVIGAVPAAMFAFAIDTVYVPGQTYFGRNGYIEYYAGDLPYILSAPHGGALMPSEIPDRTYGTYTTDTHTEEAARAFIEAVFARTGHHPHVVICRLDRIKIDANRDSVEGAQGNVYALQAWQEYHQFLEAARKKVYDDYGKGLYIDLHGHGHSIQRLEIGYLLSAAVYGLSDASLNNSVYVNASSVRTLAQVEPGGLAAVVRGPRSLGTYFENRGYPAVPSSMQRSPGADIYFNGGYNTDRYGSKYRPGIDGIQIEANYSGVRDTETNYRRFAAILAEIYDHYTAFHYFGATVPASSLVINEFMFDVPADDSGTPALEGDANSDGVRSPRGDEFIEIINTGAAPASLGGYQILERGLLPVFTFPDTAVLQPGQYAVVFGGVGPAGFGSQLPPSAQYFAAKQGQADSGFYSTASRTNYLGGGDNVIFFDPRSNVVFGEVFWGSGVQETIEGQKLIAPFTFLGDSIAGTIGQSVTRNPDLTGKWTGSLSYVTVPYTPGVPSSVTGVGADATALPEAIALEQNYPNPFNPTTNFGFRIADFGFVRVSVFDLLGREVAVLVNGELMPGRHVVRWDASEMPSGIYFYTMTSGEVRLTRRMILLK